MENGKTYSKINIFQRNLEMKCILTLSIDLYDKREARGESGIIFACLAHMKVPFIPEQQLFTERKYWAVSKGFLRSNSPIPKSFSFI